MSERDVRRFVADLLGGRRPRAFRAGQSEAAQVRAAVTLRAARPGSGVPREEFVTALRQQLAAAQAAGQPPGPGPDARPASQPGSMTHSTRRRFVAAASIAAAAAAAGAGTDHVLTSSGPAPGRDTAAGADQTIVPDTGQWRTVAASADLPEGGVQGFDLGTVAGFVTRTAGNLAAVSGVCTHQGCRLALDPAARQLNCPCHNTSFAVTGQLLHHQLALPPRALPHYEVREAGGMVQVYAPPGPGV